MKIIIDSLQVKKTSKFVEDGLCEGELSAGVSVIINVRDSEYGRAKFEKNFKD